MTRVSIRPIVRCAIATALAIVLVGAAAPSRADITYNPSSWNGYKIYLSRAHVDGTNNYGCDNMFETRESRHLSNVAAGGAGLDLYARGYKVRIGTNYYTDNADNSDTWGADYHVPLHSNAQAGSSSNWDCTAPYNLNQSASGTLVFYYSTSSGGKDMAASFVTYIASVSPGKGQDKKTSNNGLYEIYSTNAKAVYLESGYHTFGADKDWIMDHDGWGWRIGTSIDNELGYP